MSGTAKFLGPFKIVDELDEKPTKKSQVKNKKVTGNTTVEEPKIKKTPKSETQKNNLITLQNPTKPLQDKTREVVKDNESVPRLGHTNQKSRESEQTRNNCLNPQKETNKASVESAKEDVQQGDEKCVKSCDTGVSHDDQTSVISCHQAEEIENAEDCDKDEEDQEEPMNSHPYSFMIDNFQLTKEQKIQTKIGPPKSLKETPLRMVNSRIGLLKLLPALNSAKEIALTVQMDNYQFEHNIQLLEISTRDTDYIIDVEKLKSEMLLLTEIFINPKITKIVYSSKRILTALQNILHLYLINIFDCERAGRFLQTGHTHMDTILLKEYSYEIDPKMRSVDCRARPLSSQFQDYCRSVPHYLIYIYHDYKNKLLSKDEHLYNELMNEFRETSKIIYPNFMETKLLSLEEELQELHNCQLEVLEKLNKWRNETAIKLRKVPKTIIANPQLITLSSVLPVTELSVCCISNNSPFVKDDVGEILKIIKEAKQMHNLERLPMSSKKKITNLKEFLLGELDIYTSDLNADNPKMSFNECEKPKDQKIGEVAFTSRNNRLDSRRRKYQALANLQATQQNTNNASMNNDYSPGYVKQAAPVHYNSPQTCSTSKDSSSISNDSVTGSRSSSGTSISYNDLEVQKRIIALKRKLSSYHQWTDNKKRN